MEQDINLKNINNEELVLIDKLIYDFVKELEKEIAKINQEEVS